MYTFILWNSMCSTPFRIENLLYIGCNDFHHPFLEPSPLSVGNGPSPFHSKNFWRIRCPMDWYIRARHFPEWYFKSYQYKHPSILAKIFHHGWRKFWILTSPTCFKLPFGRHSQNQYLWVILIFFIKKFLIPPFLKPSPFVFLYPIFVSIFSTTLSWIFCKGPFPH